MKHCITSALLFLFCLTTLAGVKNQSITINGTAAHKRVVEISYDDDANVVLKWSDNTYTRSLLAQTISDIAPVLQEVWSARRTLAPAFGTMMGTSELIIMSMQMDEQWIGFIKSEMKNPGVSQAMEEFLFGISTEQIQQLKEILKTKGIPAISRDEVSTFLGEHVKVDAGLDYRDFYSMYTIRRDNARSRHRLKLEGPHKTLEDYYIQYITAKNKEKQNNDIFAK